jgi:hypothetical protein
LRNLEDARDKARDLLENAQLSPRARRATRPSRAVKENRLRAKHVTAVVKERRRSVQPED